MPIQNITYNTIITEIKNWIKKKQKETYVRIEEGWRNCEFQYDWLNNN